MVTESQAPAQGILKELLAGSFGYVLEKDGFGSALFLFTDFTASGNVLFIKTRLVTLVTVPVRDRGGLHVP